MHTTLKLNNLFLVARKAALNPKLKNNFKNLTEVQREILLKIFDDLQEFQNNPHHPIQSISENEITNITNTLIEPESCWSRIKRFVLSLFGWNYPDPVQKKARKLPHHFRNYRSYQLETTRELEKNMNLNNEETLAIDIFNDWIRLQISDDDCCLFLIEKEADGTTKTKPVMMDLSGGNHPNYKDLIPEEIKNFLNNDAAAILRVARFFTQGVHFPMTQILDKRYPTISRGNDGYRYFFEKNDEQITLHVELFMKAKDRNGFLGIDFLTFQSINLSDLDSKASFDIYSTNKPIF